MLPIFTKQEKKLAKSESMYRSVLSTMSEGVVFHDLEGNLIAANALRC